MDDNIPKYLQWRNCPSCSDKILTDLPQSWRALLKDLNPQVISRLSLESYPIYKCADCQTPLRSRAQTHCLSCGSPLATMKLVVDNTYTCQKCSWRFDVSILKSQAEFRQPDFVEWKTWPATVRCAFDYTDWIGTRRFYVDLFAETPLLSLEIAEKIVEKPTDYVSAFCPLCWFLEDIKKPMMIECYLRDDYRDFEDGCEPSTGEKFSFVCNCSKCQARIGFNKLYYGASAKIKQLVRSEYIKGLSKKVPQKGVRVTFVGVEGKPNKAAPKKIWWPF